MSMISMYGNGIQVMCEYMYMKMDGNEKYETVNHANQG